MSATPTISDQQLRQFEQDGYLLVKGLLDRVQDLDPVSCEYTGVLDRSRSNPSRELHDPAAWERTWREARDHLAQVETNPFNRWTAGHPACA